jgi:hypothetical protein
LVEVIGLRWGHVQLGSSRIFSGLVKGDDYTTRAVRDLRLAAALLDYLDASDRRTRITADSPPSMRHDERLTGHAFVRNLKAYAPVAGAGDTHVQTDTHSFARLVADQTGSTKNGYTPLASAMRNRDNR